MKIAITGSSGLIGQALVSHLNQQGHTIVQLVRSQAEARGPANCWWEPQRGVLELEKLDGVSVMVHLAGRSIGQHRWTAHEKALLDQSRVEATERLCDSLKQLGHPLELFVGASAVGIYGERGEAVVREEDSNVDQEHSKAVDARDTASDFSLVNLAHRWEAAAHGMLALGTTVVHTRFGVVLSPEGGALAKMLPLFRWGLGSSLGSGRQYWSWITLEDTVRAIAWIIERRQPQTGMKAYNLVAPQPVTNAEFTRLLAQRLKRMRFLPVPKFALRIGLGEMADALLLTSCRAVPERLIHEGFEFKWPELEAALASLDL